MAALARDGQECKGRRMFLSKSDPYSMETARKDASTWLGATDGSMNGGVGGAIPGGAAGSNPLGPDNDQFAIFIKNLTYDTTEEQLKEFLNNGVGVTTVRFSTDSKGRRNGECFVVYSNFEDAQSAMKMDGKSFHGRKAMLHRSTITDFQRANMSVPGSTKNLSTWDGTVRLCGFTYSSDVNTVLNFCQGLKVIPNRVVLEKDEQGRTKSNAAVQFATFSDAEECLKRNKSTLDVIGRYIGPVFDESSLIFDDSLPFFRHSFPFFSKN